MRFRLRHITRTAGLPLLITLILGGIVAPELHRVTHAVDMARQTAQTESGQIIDGEDGTALHRHRATACEQQCQLCRRDLIQVTLTCAHEIATLPTAPLEPAAVVTPESPDASAPHVRGPPLT